MDSKPINLVLEPAALEDIPTIADLWFASFTEPLVRHMFPDTPGMRKWVRDEWYAADFHKPHVKYLRVVDTEAKDEQGRPRIVGFAKWDTSTPQERGRRFPPWHDDSPKEECEGMIGGLDDERVRIMKDQRHYYLDTLGTHPDYQRRGAGSLAVKWGCDMADKDGVSAYVDANKEGAGLYKKYGFLDYSQPGAVIASMARGKTGL